VVSQNAAVPLTFAEEELKMVKETETNHHINVNSKHQTVQGISFPISDEAIEKIEQMKSGSINYVQLVSNDGYETTEFSIFFLSFQFFVRYFMGCFSIFLLLEIIFIGFDTVYSFPLSWAFSRNVQEVEARRSASLSLRGVSKINNCLSHKHRAPSLSLCLKFWKHKEAFEAVGLHLRFSLV